MKTRDHHNKSFFSRELEPRKSTSDRTLTTMMRMLFDLLLSAATVQDTTLRLLIIYGV
jgi:hypothetical protein